MFQKGMLLCLALAMGTSGSNWTIPNLPDAPFYEGFPLDASSALLETKWIPSGAKKEGEGDDELLRYRGEWDIDVPAYNPAFEGDAGLIVKTAAAHHAISALFKKPISTSTDPLIVQYEVKLQNGLECGGAYMKLLSHDKNFSPEAFQDSTPYTIMFGPDRCGSTNKVHFIFRHQNPKSKEFEEKHLKAPPASEYDRLTNVYTLIVKPDNSFQILINGDEKKAGSLLEDFAPAVNPPKEIDDPKDKKPADWVDQAKIPDPAAKKPDDWDEDAPARIVDADAKKPSDWLDDEPEEVDDPEAERPEDWDEEEDGEWTAPKVPNPKCAQASGCGEWKPPMISNPNYKGKWTAPMIDNPAYKGPWSPKKIPNPDYFEDKFPARFTPIGAIGFELWTMQDGIVFDNIYVGHSLDEANTLLAEGKAKREIEKAATDEEKSPFEDEEDDPKATFYDKARKAFKSFSSRLGQDWSKFAKRVQADPIEAAKQFPHFVIALVLALVAPTSALFYFATGGKDDSAQAKKTDDITPDDEQEEVADDAKEDSRKRTRSASVKKRTTKAAPAEED